MSVIQVPFFFLYLFISQFCISFYNSFSLYSSMPSCLPVNHKCHSFLLCVFLPLFLSVCLTEHLRGMSVCHTSVSQCSVCWSVCGEFSIPQPNPPQCKLNVSLKFNNKLTTALIRYLKVSDCSYLWCWTCCDLNKVKEIAERCCWYWYYRFFSFYLLSLAIFSQLVVAIFFFFFSFFFSPPNWEMTVMVTVMTVKVAASLYVQQGHC